MPPPRGEISIPAPPKSASREGLCWRGPRRNIRLASWGGCDGAGYHSCAPREFPCTLVIERAVSPWLLSVPSVGEVLPSKHLCSRLTQRLMGRHDAKVVEDPVHTICTPARSESSNERVKCSSITSSSPPSGPPIPPASLASGSPLSTLSRCPAEWGQYLA